MKAGALVQAKLAFERNLDALTHVALLLVNLVEDTVRNAGH